MVIKASISNDNVKQKYSLKFISVILHCELAQLEEAETEENQTMAGKKQKQKPQCAIFHA